MWHALVEPWQEPIMQRALLEVALIGACGGLLGCWVVFYELSYSAESLAHALFPGLVVAALLGLPLLLGAGAGIVGAALVVGLAARTPGIESDTAVAGVGTGLFGLGVLLAPSAGRPPGLQGLLFGDVLGVTDGDLLLAGSLALVVVGSLRALHGRLLVVGFDRSSARQVGISAAIVDACLLVLLALTILVAVQGLGNLLVVAVLVAPPAPARLLAPRGAPMMGLSGGGAVAARRGGLYPSSYPGTPAGAPIA